MKNAVCLLGVMMLMLACKKESSPSRTDYLTGTRWGWNKLTLESPLGQTPVDITLTTLKPCELDDPIYFKSGGAFSAADSNSICVPSNNSVFNSLSGGSWSLTNNDSVITIVKGFQNQPFRIKTITASSIEMYQQQNNYLGQLVRYTYVLRAVE